MTWKEPGVFIEDFAFLVYLLGNLSLCSCGLIILYNCRNKANDIVSESLQIILMLSSFLRAWWTLGFSDDEQAPVQADDTKRSDMKDVPLWDDAHEILHRPCQCEVYLSCVIWTLCVLVLPKSNKEKQTLPFWARWYSLLLLAFIGPILLLLNRHIFARNSGSSPTFYAFIAPYNMTMDTVAIIPQLLLVKKNETRSCVVPPKWLGHIVGLLSILHVSRVVFWIAFFWTRGSEERILYTFMIPDIIGVCLMSDFLYVYLKVCRAEVFSIWVAETDRISGDITDEAAESSSCNNERVDAFLSTLYAGYQRLTFFSTKGKAKLLNSLDREKVDAMTECNLLYDKFSDLESCFEMPQKLYAEKANFHEKQKSHYCGPTPQTIPPPSYACKKNNTREHLSDSASTAAPSCGTSEGSEEHMVYRPAFSYRA